MFHSHSECGGEILLGTLLSNVTSSSPEYSLSFPTGSVLTPLPEDTECVWFIRAPVGYIIRGDVEAQVQYSTAFC